MSNLYPTSSVSVLRSGIGNVSSNVTFVKLVKQEKPANILSSQYLEQLNVADAIRSCDYYAMSCDTCTWNR